MEPNTRSPLTTLCYLETDKKYLMLHRVSKKNDVNKDKWIGIGGHFEADESPEECLLREVKEETGLNLLSYCFRGLITFICDGWPTEYMCLYTSDHFEGELIECDEGTLEWVDKDKVQQLNLWEGDKIFFQLLAEEVAFFSLKLSYKNGVLVEAIRDGKLICGN
jgi:8-oxo-dGTP diphosphatase